MKNDAEDEKAVSALGGGNGVGGNSKQLTQADDELTPVAKGKVVYYLAENLQKFYRTVGHPRHESTCYQIAGKYVKRHNLLDKLINRLEIKNGTERVAPYLYTIRAGVESLKKTGEWPGEEEEVQARMKNRDVHVDINEKELSGERDASKTIRTPRICCRKKM